VTVSVSTSYINEVCGVYSSCFVSFFVQVTTTRHLIGPR